MTIYMAVTADELELPVAVSESARELSEMVNCKRNSIFVAIKRKSVGKDIKFVKVEIDDEVDA